MIELTKRCYWIDFFVAVLPLAASSILDEQRNSTVESVLAFLLDTSA